MELLLTTPGEVKLWTALLGLPFLVAVWLVARGCYCRRGHSMEPEAVSDQVPAQDHVQRLDALIADARRALADLLEATLVAVHEGVNNNLASALNDAVENKLAQPLKATLDKLGKLLGAVHALAKDGFPETKQAVVAGLKQLQALLTDNHATLTAAVEAVTKNGQDMMEKLVAMGRSLNGHVDDLHKRLGGAIGELLGLVKPMPGVVVAVKNLCEKITGQIAELKKPAMDTATMCQDNRQMLQRTREELATVLEQLSNLHCQLEGLSEAVAELKDRLPERPPQRTPPTTAIQAGSPAPVGVPAVQPLHFSIADHLAPPMPTPMAAQPAPPGPSPSAEVLLQQAMLLMQQRRR